MTPEALLELLFFAANAKTDEEKARVAWRASDYMWLKLPTFSIPLCRQFNNLLQDKEYPWANGLMTKEEVEGVLWNHRTNTNEKQ